MCERSQGLDSWQRGRLTEGMGTHGYGVSRMTEATAYNRPVKVLDTFGTTAHIKWEDNNTYDCIPTDALEQYA